MVAETEVLKRKHDEEEAATYGVPAEGLDSAEEAAAKRAASEVVPVVAEAQVVGLRPMRNEDFSPDLLRIYYDRLFPFQKMYRWLRYGNDPKSSNKGVSKDFFIRREFTFVLAGDVYCRYQCFRDAEEYRAKVIQQQPVRMEIGAVYTHPPKNHNTVVKDAYRPVERELVFDIDMDDYDGLRTCCTGSKLCSKCWTFMKAAIATLRRVLRDDFGFKHMLFVYSGRRGVHCWVCDRTARRLSNEQRSAVADYLSLVTPGAGKTRAELKMYDCDEVHPSIQAAYEICEHYFKEDAGGVLRGQDILRKGPCLANLLASLTDAEREQISTYIKNKPGATSVEIWKQFEVVGEARLRSAGGHKAQKEAKLFLRGIVIQYTYPRLDINVSKQMNHLLKSPFVVHPKTGRVCVPIDPAKAESFDPAEVPTIGRLVEELNASGDVRETSLKQYTEFFETQFLAPLEKQCLEELKLGATDW